MLTSWLCTPHRQRRVKGAGQEPTCYIFASLQGKKKSQDVFARLGCLGEKRLLGGRGGHSPPELPGHLGRSWGATCPGTARGQGLPSDLPPLGRSGKQRWTEVVLPPHLGISHPQPPSKDFQEGSPQRSGTTFPIILSPQKAAGRVVAQHNWRRGP